MKQFGAFALYSWVPFTLLLFAMLPARRAALVSYIGGWLFLPMTKIPLPGMPELWKATAASFGVFVAIVLFDSKSLFGFRPRWYDLPMLLWCLCPAYTSIKMNLGMMDAIAVFLDQLAVWGIPYFVGRLYFKDLASFKELGEALVIGAICYIPFLWFEMWFSPQLHKLVYGVTQHDPSQSRRWGGFRPLVFMQTGLACATYMMTASVTGIWMWYTGAVKKIWNFPAGPLMLFLFITAILCKTMAAIAFLFMALGALLWIKMFRKAPGIMVGLPIIVLVSIAPIYEYLRATKLADTERINDIAKNFTSEERLQSFRTRLDAEDLLTARAAEAPSPLWGWGKWDKNDRKKVPWRVYKEYWKRSPDGIPYLVRREAAPTDGLWVIVLGQFGKAGLITLTITILLPALILWRRIPLRFWNHPLVAPAAAMSLLLVLHMVDNLLNGMVNPIFVIGLGGLSAIGPPLSKTMRQYGENAVLAQLAILGGQPVAAVPQSPQPRGFPVTPMGYPPNAGGGMGFPVIPGLRPGGMPQTEPPRRRQ